MLNDLPPWQEVYDQMKRWLLAGCFDVLVHDLRAVLRLAEGRRAGPTVAVLDSRTVRRTPDSGARATWDGHKRTKGSKLYMAPDTLGHLLALHVTPANANDRTAVAALAQAVQDAAGESVTLAYVDQGYTGALAAKAAQAHGIKLVEAKRGFVLPLRRWVAELSFAWQERCHRLGRWHRFIIASNEKEFDMSFDVNKLNNKDSIDSDDLRVTLLLNTGLQISLSTDVKVSLKSRKAQALIVLLALSKTHSVSRHLVAATLWSNVERPTGLARLRDVLYLLRKEFHEAGIDIIDVRHDTILLKLGATTIEIGLLTVEKMSKVDQWPEFLVELENIDPALDRWLVHIRAECQRENCLVNELNITSVGLAENKSSLFEHRSDHPIIAVLDLNYNNDPTNINIFKNFSSEIGGFLSKFRWFSTMIRNVHGKKFTLDVEDLSKIASYALIGTAGSDRDKDSLLVELIDLNDCGMLKWSELFEGERFSSVELSQVVFRFIAARLDTELLLLEIKKRQSSSWQNSAYGVVLQALPAIYRLDRNAFLDAGHLLERAVLMDRESPFAYGWLAYWYVFLVGQGWASNPVKSMGNAAKAAARAMILDPKDARATAIAGHVKAFLTHHLQEATTLHEMALQLNPALALAWHLSGMTHAYAGRLDEAAFHISQCIKLVPNDPFGFFVEGGLVIVHLLRHEHPEAVELGRRVAERHPSFTSSLKSYLAALGHAGHRSKAKEVHQRLLLLEPHFSLRRFQAAAPYQRPQDLEHFMAGLRLAGVN